MIEELQLINHYLESKDPKFLSEHGVDGDYFIAMREVVDWIENYKDTLGGTLPTISTVSAQFDDFQHLTDLDAPAFLVNTLRENRAYMEFRPVMTDGATMVSDGNTLEAMWEMRGKIDELLRRYNSEVARYDWVANAPDRYDEYMKKHGIDGVPGIATGVKALDELTGGWQDDDLLLITARLGEGKSLLALYFAYKAWISLTIAGEKKPIVFISTEMPKLEVSYRLDTLRGHFSNRALNRGKLADPELYKEYLMGLADKETPFLIYTPDENGGRQFTTKDIQNIYETEQPALVVIDQLYDISDGTKETDIRRNIVNTSNDIRRINLTNNVPTILVTQAGRESAKDGRKDPNATPEIHQIQESDNPAQKATIVLSLRQMDDGMFKASIKKNRGGEKDKDIFLRASIDTGMWDEVDECTAVF